jgi:hypothetical protein
MPSKKHRWTVLSLLSEFAAWAAGKNSAEPPKINSDGARRGAWSLVLLCAGLAQGDGLPPTLTPPRHVVVLLIDTLSSGHLPFHGYPVNTAPFLSGLAAEAAVYTGAVSTSTYTPEAVGSLFTGLYPSRSPWGAGWHARPSLKHPTLATVFQDAGYATALFSNSPMLDHPEFLRGFDVSACQTEFGLSGGNDRLAEQGLAWLEQRKHARSLLYLHFLDPHGPYQPPNEAYRHLGGTGASAALALDTDLRDNLPDLVAEGFGPGDARFDDLVRCYDAEIYDVDAAIGRFFAGLTALGIADETLVVLTADHGEEFLEHGFMEHAWKLYPETFRVPLLFWAPGRVAAGRNGGVVSLVDVMPTVTRIQGLRQAGAVDGTPLMSPGNGGVWQHQPAGGPRIMELLIESRCVVRGVVSDSSLYLAYWKYLSPEECAATAGQLKTIRAEYLDGTRPPVDLWGAIVREEYYDLNADPGCQRDRAALEPDAVSRWRSYLLEYGKSCPPQFPDRYKVTRDPSLLSEEQRALLDGIDSVYLQPRGAGGVDEEMLKALGYL